MNDKWHSIAKTTYTVNGKVYKSIDDIPPEYRELIQNIEMPEIPKTETQFVKSESIKVNTVVDMSNPGNSSGKTTYDINGKVYNSLDDVPTEYREKIRNMKMNGAPKAQMIESKRIHMDYLNASSGDDHREKFLREAVYPNRRLIDEKAFKKIVTGVQGKDKNEDDGKGIMSFIRRLRKAFE